MGFIEGFVNGFARAVAGGRIDRLCSELGWSIDERKGNQITLNFNCPLFGTRPIFIREGDEALVFITAYSLTPFDSRRVPEDVMGFALWQSSQSTTGKWEVRVYEGQAYFVLAYNALGAGLDAAALKYICGTMGKTASDFDAKMKQEGYGR